MKAIIRHTLTVYEALYAAAEDEISSSFFVDEKKVTPRVFRGKVTEVFSSTGVGQGYYSEVFRQLELQGCITFLQRGAKSVDSVIICHYPPTEEGYQPRPKSPLTDPERYANLSEDVDTLKILVGGLHIPKALKEMQDRIKKLEAQQVSEVD